MSVGTACVSVLTDVGIIILLVVSKLSGDGGIKLRTKFGELLSFVLQRMTAKNKTATYACINCGKAVCPTKIEMQSDLYGQ